MKRFLTLLLVLGLTVGMAATGQARKAERKRVVRTVQGSYTTPWVPFAAKCRREGALGCLTIETRENEAFLTAKVVDAHGTGLCHGRGSGSRPGAPTLRCLRHVLRRDQGPIPSPRGVDVRLRVAFWTADLPTSLTTVPPCSGRLERSASPSPICPSHRNS